MKKSFPILILLVSIFIGSCKKDECADRIDQKLDSYAVEAVPYETGQIIAFNTSNSDLINVSAERISEILKPDAPYVCEGYLEVRLTDSNSGALFVELLMRGSTNSNLIQIIVFHDKIDGPIIQFQVDKNQELFHFSSDGESIFYNQLTIDGVEYRNVLKLTYPNLLEDKWIKEFYYNAEFGILKIVTNDNFTLSLM